MFVDYANSTLPILKKVYYFIYLNAVRMNIFLEQSSLLHFKSTA